MSTRASSVRVRVVANQAVPAVNVKVPPLYWRLPEDVRDQDKNSLIFDRVAEDWWDRVPQDVADACFAAPFRGMRWSTHQDGRSNGWLVVTGIGDPLTWNQKKIAAWVRFEKMIKRSMEQAEATYVEKVREHLKKWGSKP